MSILALIAEFENASASVKWTASSRRDAARERKRKGVLVSSQPSAYLSGVLTGVVLTVLVAFLIDYFGSGPDTRMIVNWTVLAEKVGAVKEEVRKDVHEATAPDVDATSTAPAFGDTH